MVDVYQELRQNETRKELYQHHRGQFYLKVLECLREGDLKRCTVYMSLLDGVLWMRPSEEFHELVAINNEGEKAPRFRRVAFSK